MTNTDELERLARAATPGPWMHLFGDRSVHDRMSDGCRGNTIVSAEYTHTKQDADNLSFIAAANPAAMLDLIEQIEREKAQNAELRSQLDDTQKRVRHFSAKADSLLAAWDQHDARQISYQADFKFAYGMSVEEHINGLISQNAETLAALELLLDEATRTRDALLNGLGVGLVNEVVLEAARGTIANAKKGRA